MLKRKLASSPLPATQKKARPTKNGERSEGSKTGEDYRAFLNLDIRAIIYDYMDLPPFGNGKDWMGLVLSCKTANAEMRHVAARQLKAYIETTKKAYEKTTGLTMEVPAIAVTGSWSALRTVTIIVPPAAIKLQYSDAEPPSPLEKLEPLFSLWLDKLTISLKGTVAEAKKALPASHIPNVDGYHYRTPLFFAHTLSKQTPWLRYIADVPTFLRGYYTYNLSSAIVSVVGTREYSPKPMYFKKLAIAWDFRTRMMAEREKNHRTEVRMAGGMLYYHYPHALFPREIRHCCDHGYAGLKYQLSGPGGYTGECGMLNSKRWAVSHGCFHGGCEVEQARITKIVHTGTRPDFYEKPE
ncbi:hypothetical protein P280DRAFT_14464 [Massarina eburnea CBS 473.64]|uniref:Uncharacterized protein n=1 Tax=Massarina eburnea CBS 473.64 TaxID=1395130 RepID=A0A6A6SHW5_9PLEO|nr:hypothetical protein P280DRAFT_14464 [Massarina eburnea CBS 473.64]